MLSIAAGQLRPFPHKDRKERADKWPESPRGRRRGVGANEDTQPIWSKETLKANDG